MLTLRYHTHFHAWKGILMINTGGQSKTGSSFSGYLSRDTPIHNFTSWLLCIYQSGIICLQGDNLIQTNWRKKETLFVNPIIFPLMICLFHLQLVRPGSVWSWQVDWLFSLCLHSPGSFSTHHALFCAPGDPFAISGWVQPMRDIIMRWEGERRARPEYVLLTPSPTLAPISSLLK